MRQQYQGKLVYNDQAEYVVVGDDGQQHCVSKILDKIYYSDQDNSLEIEIYVAGKLKHSESGILNRIKNKHGFYSYHLGTLYDLDFILFKLVSRRVDILIKWKEDFKHEEKAS